MDKDELTYRQHCKLLVGKITHNLCNILDNTRGFNPKLRLIVLREVEQDLLRRIDHIASIQNFTIREKRQSLKQIAADLRKLNPKRRRKSTNDDLFSFV